MRMCQSHWDQLRKAIDDRGLSGLVAQSGGKAIENLQSELEEGRTKRNFDPLMAANLAIWSNALDMGGLYLMGADENGKEYCPICESEAHGGQPGEWWITNAANEQLEHAKSLGLLPDAS